MQRAFHSLMNSTAMSHTGPRLLAFASSYSCSQTQRFGFPVLTLEQEKKVGDVTSHVKYESPSISEQIPRIYYQHTKV